MVPAGLAIGFLGYALAFYGLAILAGAKVGLGQVLSPVPPTGGVSLGSQGVIVATQTATAGQSGLLNGLGLSSFGGAQTGTPAGGVPVIGGSLGQIVGASP